MPGAENGEEPRRGGQAPAGGFAAWAVPKCAQCHEANVAATKGGKFTLLQQGRLAELSPEKTGEVIRRLSLPDGHADQMPARGGPKVTAAERLDGVRLFVEADGK